mmetsp:Transcript_16691/g.24676  ORF Transcript_16691/g.24676 Transcript_16691/m.24676 type:complete len:350 (-) Transcript_16691:235-1284(-)
MSSSFVLPTQTGNIQNHAEKLLELANEVQKSNNERREKMQEILEETKLCSDDYGKKNEENEELKHHLQECRKALLAVQENANLKNRKLELQYLELHSALELSNKDLSTALSEISSLNKERDRMLNHHHYLREALEGGTTNDLATLLIQTKAKCHHLEKELLRLERINKHEKTVKSATSTAICPNCKRYPRSMTCKEEPPSLSAPSSTSFWNTLNEVMMTGLDSETFSTAKRTLDSHNSINSSEPHNPQSTFRNKMKLDLEADIKAMESKMNKEIEAIQIRFSLSKLPKPSSSRETFKGRRRKAKKNHTKESRVQSSKPHKPPSLESFFSSHDASLQLLEEEKDDEIQTY